MKNVLKDMELSKNCVKEEKDKIERLLTTSEEGNISIPVSRYFFLNGIINLRTFAGALIWWGDLGCIVVLLYFVMVV